MPRGDGRANGSILYVRPKVLRRRASLAYSAKILLRTERGVNFTLYGEPMSLSGDPELDRRLEETRLQAIEACNDYIITLKEAREMPSEEDES
jgi:hypothetical protein